MRTILLMQHRTKNNREWRYLAIFASASSARAKHSSIDAMMLSVLSPHNLNPIFLRFCLIRGLSLPFQLQICQGVGRFDFLYQKSDYHGRVVSAAFSDNAGQRLAELALRGRTGSTRAGPQNVHWRAT